MRNWKAAVAGGIVAGAAILCAGMATQEDGKNAVLVEEVYTVRPGDTLWGIVEEFCEKNTGTRRYIEPQSIE